jgi:hypothetical protein
LTCSGIGGATDSKSVTIQVEKPALSADIPSVEFEEQDLGTTSAVKTVRFSNKGGLSIPLVVSLVGTDASQFTLDNKCGSALSPGASCSVDLKFNPSAIGVKNAELVAASIGETPNAI